MTSHYQEYVDSNLSKEYTASSESTHDIKYKARNIAWKLTTGEEKKKQSQKEYFH